MERFQNILLVKSDLDDEQALAKAVSLAKQNQAKLTLFKVVKKIPEMSGYGFSKKTVHKIKRNVLEGYWSELDKLVKRFQDQVQIKIKICEGIPAIRIIRNVVAKKRNLVIKTADAETGLSRLFGSLDMQLLRKCPAPVWLVKPDHSGGVKRIVAAVDFDENSKDGNNRELNRKILEMALSLAHQDKAEVHVIHAWEGLPEYVLSDDSSELRDLNKEELTKEFMKSRECRLEELMNDAKSWVGKDIFNAVAPKAQVLKGRARKLIVEQIEALDADLLVMGTVARTGIPGFFIGNTAESIIDRIDCSVLAIKPDGFVSPVNKKKR